MTDKLDTSAVSRRHLLVLAPLAGVQAALPSAAEAKPSTTSPQRTDPRELRFQDNEHIRTFYRLART